MKRRQVFERLLSLQYRLDRTPPEESPQIFEDFDDALNEFQSLTGYTSDEIQDAINNHYEEYVRKQKGQ